MDARGPVPDAGGGRLLLRLAGVILAVLLTGCGEGESLSGGDSARPEPATAEELTPIPRTEWVALVQELSEPGGFFDTDNLISNERSYLHVLGPMRELGVTGGAYIGVGPDQNFAYMAQQRPWLAFVVDLRRDNLVHHVLLKAVFHESRSRLEYLALLFGRDPGAVDSTTWSLPVDSLLVRVRTLPGGAGTPEADAARRRIREQARTFGLELDAAALSTLDRFHTAFIQDGSDLRFTSFGRPARQVYPTFAELLIERDLEGEQGSYLANREDFLFLKALQEANRIVPVVADLSGPYALREVGEEIRRRGLVVRVFYTSNVEYYLWNAGTFADFAATLAELPMDERSVLIRSVFPNAARHPHTVPGYYSTQTLVPLQDVRDVVLGSGYRGYQDLVTRDAVEPTVPVR